MLVLPVRIRDEDVHPAAKQRIADDSEREPATAKRPTRVLNRSLPRRHYSLADPAAHDPQLDVEARRSNPGRHHERRRDRARMHLKRQRGNRGSDQQHDGLQHRLSLE